MGCGGSKDDSKFENPSSENKTTIATNNNIAQNGKVKIDDGILKTSFDSASPIELLHEDRNIANLERGHAVTNVTKHSPPIKQKKTPPTETGVSNAWSAGKTAHGHDQANLINDILNEDESEFGREGIDIHSTSFDGTRKKSSGRSKPMSKGIQPNGRQTEMPGDDIPKLTKKYSEEPFDPTPLIDVNKFKAVNAPKEVRKVNNNDAVTMETITTEAIGQKTVISPSNYQDFYDEDEMELMASIEQGFVATALPGVVT